MSQLLFRSNVFPSTREANFEKQSQLNIFRIESGGKLEALYGDGIADAACSLGKGERDGKS